MKNINLTILFILSLALTACHKDKEFDKTDAVVSEITSTVSTNQATFSWQVDLPGKFQTAVEVSEKENMSDLKRVEGTKEEDKYTAVVKDLSSGTQYYYRIVVWNKFNRFEKEVETFTTLETPEPPQDTTFYTISVSCQPEEGGIVSGGGTFAEGDTCTITAVANAGYDFIKWTREGSEVSTNLTYSFTVTESAEYVAHFQIQSYTISVTADPENGGTIEGAGIYEYEQTCTVKATEANGYSFVNWTENGEQVSSDCEYTFIVKENRQLMVYFEVLQPEVPIGAINGLFTINDNGDQVYFSQGNLQYIGSAGNGDEYNTGAYWKFADNQWDCFGDNGQDSYSNIVDRDLFGWGTSGYHDVNDPYNVNYHPWSKSLAIVDETNNKYGYGPSINMTSLDLTDNSANYDWGVYNSISNGGNQPGQWRVLTSDEWDYVFNTRTTSSGLRFVKAQITDTNVGANGTINGLVILPDNWSIEIYPLNNNNDGFNSNIINVSQWNTLEDAGAVFLPAAGLRDSSVHYFNVYGCYWSVSHLGSFGAIDRSFSNTGSAPIISHDNRYYGNSVRLVCPAE